MRSQFRSDFALDRLQFRRCFGRGQIKEQLLGAGQQAAAAVECCNRVLKRRRCGCVGDVFNLGPMHEHRLFERGRKVFGADALKGWKAKRFIPSL